MDAIDYMRWAARLGLLITILSATIWVWIYLRKEQPSRKSIGHSLMLSLKQRLKIFVPCAGALILVAILVPMSGLADSVLGKINTVLDGAFIFLVAWGMVLAVHIFSDLTQSRFDTSVKNNLAARQVHTKVKVLERILIVIIWMLAFAGVLMLFERFRTIGGTLLASAGVLSIVLGLSAQKTFGAIFAGLQVALSHPINLDDVVIVEGEWGRIEEIAFTYVVVKTWDLRRLVVPMTYFLETPFQNWTKKNSDLIGSVTLHADYTVPVEKVRDELKRLCEQAGPLWDGNTCGLQVTDAGPETVTLRALASASDASSAWDLRCLIREGLISYLRENFPESLPKRRIVMSGGERTEEIGGKEE